MKIELKHFVVLLSVLCIILLYFLSTLSQPQKIEISQLPDYEGKQVIIQGIVTKQHITTYEGHIINIKDINYENNFEAIIYVEEKTDVEYGDTIEALGQVQRYNDEWEVVVNSARYVTILQKWNDIIFPLWQLAENPEKYVGTNVNISGLVDRDYDSYFYLLDEENKHSIIVYYDSLKFQNFTQGDKVYVGGQFLYDEESMRYKIKVEEENHNIQVVKE